MSLGYRPSGAFRFSLITPYCQCLSTPKETVSSDMTMLPDLQGTTIYRLLLQMSGDIRDKFHTARTQKDIVFIAKTT